MRRIPSDERASLEREATAPAFGAHPPPSGRLFPSTTRGTCLAGKIKSKREVAAPAWEFDERNDGKCLTHSNAAAR